MHIFTEEGDVYISWTSGRAALSMGERAGNPLGVFTREFGLCFLLVFMRYIRCGWFVNGFIPCGRMIPGVIYSYIFSIRES